MRRRHVILIAILFINSLLYSRYISAAVCPQSLETLSFWYETAPPFSGVEQLNLVVTLKNNFVEDIEFSDVGSDTFQLWSTPNVITSIPVTINSAPSGIIPPGNNFTYDLEIDLSSLPPTEDGLAFRSVSITLGTMAPSVVPLIDASITCTPGVPIPTLNEWGTLIFLIIIVSVSAYFLRKTRIKVSAT